MNHICVDSKRPNITTTDLLVHNKANTIFDASARRGIRSKTDYYGFHFYEPYLVQTRKN